MNEKQLRNEFLQKIKINCRDELLAELNYMQILVSGRGDVMFCNNFINEAVQLLVNAVFLMEEGYYDCAFYSIRQSAETIDNMLYISTDKDKLSKWISKGWFPLDSQIKKQLNEIDNTYQEIREKLSSFFNEFDNLIKDSHKVVHKQGFDTFYKPRVFNSKEYGFDKNKELHFFDKLLRYSICRLYIFVIILDPISLILADSDLDNKLNFNPFTTPVHLAFIEKNYAENLVALIKETNFYKDIKKTFDINEEMNPYVYGVVREQFFDIEHLSKIEEQKHLLNYTEQFILNMLKSELKISEFHIGGISILPYWTSIPSNYVRWQWSSNEFDEYLNYEIKFNMPYHNVYLSLVQLFDEPLFLQHNEILNDAQIALLEELVIKSNASYEELMNKLKS